MTTQFDWVVKKGKNRFLFKSRQGTLLYPNELKQNKNGGGKKSLQK